MFDLQKRSARCIIEWFKHFRKEYLIFGYVGSYDLGVDAGAGRHLNRERYYTNPRTDDNMKHYCSVPGIIATPLVALLAAAVPGRAVDYGIEGAPLMVNRLLNPAHYSFYIKTGLWNVPTPNYFQSHPISDFLPCPYEARAATRRFTWRLTRTKTGCCRAPELRS